MNKRERVYALTNGKCFYCGCELDFDNYHIDHFVPKASGGVGGENLVPSCADCNLAKGSLSVDEFRIKIANSLDSSHCGRIINKYFRIKKQPIEFYFERLRNGVL